LPIHDFFVVAYRFQDYFFSVKNVIGILLRIVLNLYIALCDEHYSSDM
jgi:hypothetical protein